MNQENDIDEPGVIVNNDRIASYTGTPYIKKLEALHKGLQSKINVDKKQQEEERHQRLWNLALETADLVNNLENNVGSIPVLDGQS